MINEEQKEWIITAIEKGFNRNEIKKKLEGAGYDLKTMKFFMEYYDLIQIELEKERREEETVEEKEFEGNVKKFFTENKKELSRKEKKEVEKFIKGAKKYTKVLQIANKEFKKELELIKEKGWGVEKMDFELGELKKEMIDRIIESKTILFIEHPETGEDATKQNLANLDIEQLIEMMEENVETLQLIVNGKIE